MAVEEQKICEMCHERPATCHICYGHTGATRDLCEPCYKQSTEAAGFQRHLDELIRTGTCEYCGAPAKTGSFSFSSVLMEESELWCQACGEDLAEFARRPENALPEDFPFDDEAAQQRLSEQMADRERREAEFMKQRVSERRLNG